MQMTIFDLINKSPFEEMLDKLNEYEIDEYYITHFKNKRELLSIISNELSELEDYSEYKKEMLSLLNNYYKNSKDVDVIYYEDYDYNYIRLNSSRTRSNYPVFCLEMILEKDRIL